MTHFTINRPTWRNAAHGRGPTSLLNAAGCRCCLGQIAEQCGIPDDKLYGKRTPADLLPAVVPEQFKVFLASIKLNSDFAAEAMRINDDESLTDAEREENVTLLFKQHGIELEFVGDFA